LKRGGKAWLAFSVWLALCSLIAWTLPTPTLDWQPALAASQPWRWWTAVFVHWNAAHLLGNLAALAAVAALGAAAAVPGMLTLAWLTSWPLLHLGLLARPDVASELAHYGGLSGLLHSGVAVVACWLVSRAGGQAGVHAGSRRSIGLALLAGLALKIALEAPWGAALQPGRHAGMASVPWVHLSGALVGALCAWLVLARGQIHPAGPVQPGPTATIEPKPSPTAQAETP
jgi:membrane associated rhomboid family serine protease